MLRHVEPLLLVAALPAGLTGQGGDTIPRPRPPSAVEVRVRAGSAFMANFFQAPQGAPHQNVLAAAGELRLDGRFGSGTQVFVHGGSTLYSKFDPSSTVDVGLRWSTGPHVLRGGVGYRWRMPRLEVGVLGFADILHLDAGYAARPVRFIELEALVDFDDETYSLSPEKANTLIDAGGAIRFRGFGYAFSPEFGMGVGTRDVVNDAEDFDQRSRWVTLRSIPTSRLYLSLRYREQQRDYAVLDTAGSAGRREDRRQQVTLITDWVLRDGLNWTIYCNLERNNSTKASRNFAAGYLWTGLTYRLW